MGDTDIRKIAAGMWRRWKSSEEGMALITVVILGLILSTLGFTLFALATYEYNQATYRDQSASAFWLAEAAIEHAKAEIFRDSTWAAGFDSVTKGEGWYNLSIADTVFGGEDAKRLYSQGYVPRPGGGFVERDIELLVEISAVPWEFALFSMQDIYALGNPGVCGRVHGNGEVDAGGSSFDQLADSCAGGTRDHITDGFDVQPRGMHSEPWYYPSTTYYYVVGEPSHAVGPGQALVYRALTPGTPVCADSLIAGAILADIRGGIRVMLAGAIDAGDGVGVDYGAASVSYDLLTTAAIDNVFHWEAGKCSLDLWHGDEYVIVNFGEYLDGTSPAWISHLDVDDNPAYDAPIRSSVFNTRYKSGTDTSDVVALTDTENWEGGNNIFSHIQIVPENGIALLIHGIDMSGPAHIEFGTPAKPAVCYLTGDITGNFNANGNIYGTMVVLGTIDQINGNVDFHFEPGYEANLPPYLQPFWPLNPFGHITVLLWREVPPRYET